MFTRLAPLLCLGACTEPLLPTNPSAEPPPNAAIAAELVWERLGEPLYNLPDIHWVEGPCLEYPHPTLDCIAGGIYLPEVHGVWVVKNSEAVTETALAHELIHASGVLDEEECRRQTGPMIEYLVSRGL